MNILSPLVSPNLTSQRPMVLTTTDFRHVSSKDLFYCISSTPSTNTLLCVSRISCRELIFKQVHDASHFFGFERIYKRAAISTYETYYPPYSVQTSQPVPLGSVVIPFVTSLWPVTTTHPACSTFLNGLVVKTYLPQRWVT